MLDIQNLVIIEIIGRDYLGDLGVDGRVILKWILNTINVRMWTRFGWLRMGSCVLVNEVMIFLAPQKTGIS
jgi:hypothetical protein